MRRAADGDGTLVAVLLSEYEQLKEEQRLRIDIRDNLFVATPAAAPIFAMVLSPTMPGLAWIATAEVMALTALTYQQIVPAFTP